MGFIEDELKQLKDVISTIDTRIKKLEARATGGPVSTEEIRMILIGPPGAGECFLRRKCSLSLLLTGLHRKGNSGPQDQGALLLLSLGTLIHVAKT
jgi:hypothetical protein